MKRFIVFYTTDIPGRLSGAMGSDGYCPLDGRVGLHKAHSRAIERANHLARVKPHYIGYQIMNGDIRSHRPCTNPLPIPGREAEFKAAQSKGFIQW